MRRRLTAVFLWPSSGLPLARSNDIPVLNGFGNNRLRPEPIRFVRLDSEHAQSGRSVNRGLPELDLACFSKAPETFRARKAVFRSSVSQNSKVYTPDYNFLARNRNDDPAGIRWINSDLIGFTYK